MVLLREHSQRVCVSVCRPLATLQQHSDVAAECDRQHSLFSQYNTVQQTSDILTSPIVQSSLST